jgi:hypothetical protein
MTKQQIISETVEILNKLPDNKAEEIRNMLINYFNEKNNEIFEKGFSKLINDSESYNFLNEEPDLYTEKDLIVRYQ